MGKKKKLNEKLEIADHTYDKRINEGAARGKMGKRERYPQENGGR